MKNLKLFLLVNVIFSQDLKFKSFLYFYIFMFTD